MEYRIYKPRKSGDGAASKFNVSVKQKIRGDKSFDKVMVFLHSAKQSGVDNNDNASFFWEDDDNKVIMQLGTPDVSEILCVLRGLKPFVGMSPKGNDKPKGLYHRNKSGNSSLQFSVSDSNDGYYLRISSQRDGNLVAVQHTLTLGEGEILRIMLEKSVLLMLGDIE